MTVSNPETSIEDLLRHRDFVRALAAKLTRDPSAAEDLEQEAWLRALENPPRTSSSARGWFSRVLRNLAFERYRKESRRRKRELDRDMPRTAPSAADVHEHRRLRERLADSLHGLRSEDRDAIELRCAEGLPPREISARTGLQVEEVYSRLRRGFTSMRKDLDREYGDRRRWTVALIGLVRLEDGKAAAAVPAVAVSIGAIWKLAAITTALLFTTLWIWIDRGNPAGDELDGTAGPETAAVDRLEPGDPRLNEILAAAPSAARVDAAPAAPVEKKLANGDLLVELFWNRPRERASEIPILVEMFQNEKETSYVVTTEQDGRAQLQLPVGVYTITPGHGRPQRARILGAEVTRMEFLINHGRPLTVHVRRPEATRHVPDAEVYTSWPNRPDTAYLLGRTNHAGTLFVQDVCDQGWIRAYAEGLGSSERLSLTTPLDRSRGRMRILLDLVEAAPPITVKVVDASGRPVPGARVHLGVEVDPYFGGKGVLRLPPRDVDEVTDESGTARLESVRATERFIRARAFGYVPTRTPLPAGADVVTVELARPAVVHGTVYDPDGKAIPGAYVRYSPIRGAREFVETRAGDDGAYRLERLPPGVVTLTAIDYGLPRPHAFTAELTVEAGQEYAWSPRLALASGIGGRAVDAHGRPLHGFPVALERTEDALARSELDLVTPRDTMVHIRTNEEGCFFFPHAVPGDYWVALNTTQEVVLDWRENVPYGTLDLELCATVDRQPNSRITGSIRSPSGIPPNVEIHVRGPLLRRVRRIPVIGKTGEFFIQDLNATRYSFEVWAPGYPAQDLPGFATIELAPGELLDLGELVLPPRLVVEAR